MVPNIFISLKINIEKNKTIPKNAFECIKSFVEFYIKKIKRIILHIVKEI